MAILLRWNLGFEIQFFHTKKQWCFGSKQSDASVIQPNSRNDESLGAQVYLASDLSDHMQRDVVGESKAPRPNHYSKYL